MTRRRTLYLPALIVVAGLMACAAALVALEKVEATFPGKNGKIAYVGDDGNDTEIYTINRSGGGKTQVTHDNTYNLPSFLLTRRQDDRLLGLGRLGS